MRLGEQGAGHCAWSEPSTRKPASYQDFMTTAHSSSPLHHRQMQMMRMFNGVRNQPERVLTLIKILGTAKAYTNGFGRIAIGRESRRRHRANPLRAQLQCKLGRVPSALCRNRHPEMEA